MFDIKEQTKLGNLWESVDIFKTIFSNVQIDNPEYKEIQEGWLNLPVLENSDNLYELRDFLLEWNFFDDTWVGRKLSDAGTAIKDTIRAWDKVKEMGLQSEGDWKEILSLLGKGVLFILRKLKDTAYSTIGIIVDALELLWVLVKQQVVVWGLITALDVYQIAKQRLPDGDDREPFMEIFGFRF